MVELKGIRIHITGIVQGVGFRPFVYGLADRLNLRGWVRNTSAGVDIQVDGTSLNIDQFIDVLRNDFPPLARIDSILVEHCAPNGFSNFEIIHSEPIPGAFMPISPDVAICEDCLQELRSPADRRYGYPFINCTNCGPRFTIIEDIPYDRPKTTMAPFRMCDFCNSEYEDPLNRRFHAQPVACPVCGPHIWVEDRGLNPEDLESAAIKRISNNPELSDEKAMEDVRRRLVSGEILGIKGLGGFHLACDATNSEAVSELRQRKLRVDKPFALMMPDIATVERHCYLSGNERSILTSRERPVVILRRKPESNISLAVAPNNNTLGVLLPYTPLHYLLFNQTETSENYPPNSQVRQLTALVMTSGNLSEEPIAYRNNEARTRLSKLADAFVLHDREIRTRCDDSVVRDAGIHKDSSDVEKSTPTQLYFLRRSRGYAPDAIMLPWEMPQILATGPELKNTFCLTKEHYAFLSHHIGDMENLETFQSFVEGIDHYQKLFRINPEMIACDLHPDYLATRYALQHAESEQLPIYRIQHHHAHIAACMADNNITGDRQILGIAFDGTGYGDDGNIWGGEFLIGDYRGYRRFAQLTYSPLPGGDAAIRKPYRTALAHLWHYDIHWDDDLPPVNAACGDELTMLRSMLENEISTPLTSSMGRLFDTVAALVGVRAEVNFEAQAAIEFESLADPHEKGEYQIEIVRTQVPDPEIPVNRSEFSLRFGSLLNEVIYDLRCGISIPIISARFHNGLCRAVLEICQHAQNQYGISEIALSGGVWQNMILLRKTVRLLENYGFKVYFHKQVPTNDGGIALGQAAIASQVFQP